MDKIWYRNPSKSGVIGRCGGDEKANDHAEPTKVERLNKTSEPYTYSKNSKSESWSSDKSLYHTCTKSLRSRSMTSCKAKSMFREITTFFGTFFWSDLYSWAKIKSVWKEYSRDFSAYNKTDKFNSMYL